MGVSGLKQMPMGTWRYMCSWVLGPDLTRVSILYGYLSTSRAEYNLV